MPAAGFCVTGQPVFLQRSKENRRKPGRSSPRDAATPQEKAARRGQAGRVLVAFGGHKRLALAHWDFEVLNPDPDPKITRIEPEHHFAEGNNVPFTFVF